ncbi:MAG: TIGR02147 family protein, partial [Bdellovibrio sp.]
MKQTNSFHVSYLNQELERRLLKNSQYSLRSFARDLSITSSWLSEVLNGKKGISAKKSKELCYSLGLSATESKLFQLSVKSCHARKEKDRKEALLELKNVNRAHGSSSKMQAEDFGALSDWYHLAILELTELDDCENRPEWFAKKLNLPVKIISEAVKHLIDQKQLKVVDGKLKASHAQTETTFDVPSETIKKYHRQILEKASHAIQEQAVQQREFLNMTLAFNAEKTKEAKQALRKFQQEFAEKFYDENK